MATDVATAPVDRAVVLRTLLLDAVAAQTTALLAEHGVPAILLKGRVTAAWLYARQHPQLRRRRPAGRPGPAGPGRRGAGHDRLPALARRCGRDRVRHQRAGAGRSERDLHRPAPHPARRDRERRAVLGGALGADRADDGRRSDGDRARSGRPDDAPGPARRPERTGRRQGGRRSGAWTGPAAGVELWQEAEGIARSVAAQEAFAAGLRAVESGRVVADRLGLRPPGDVELVLRSWSAPAEALQIQKFIEARRSAAGCVSWPASCGRPRAYMFGRDPAARRSAIALLGARMRRLAGLPSKLSVALWNWNRARRTVRELAPAHLTATRGKELS